MLPKRTRKFCRSLFYIFSLILFVQTHAMAGGIKSFRISLDLLSDALNLTYLCLQRSHLDVRFKLFLPVSQLSTPSSLVLYDSPSKIF